MKGEDNMRDIILVENHYYVGVKSESFRFVDIIKKEEKFIPFTNVECLIFDHRNSYFSNKMIEACVQKNISVIFCDGKHNPVSVVTSTFGHVQRLKRIKSQLKIDQKTKNRLWRKIIMAKINNQADCLIATTKKKEMGDFLRLVSKQVNEGDTTNREAYAARRYFIELFGSNFKRGRFDDAVNAGLNYGYAIFRAIIKQQLAIHGFEPSIGIHHESTENPFNLSDDIIEVYRPFVDACVYESIFCQNVYSLENENKKELIKLLLENCVIDNKVCTLYDAIKITVESLINCFSNKSASSLKLPTFIEGGK